ncbi:MAG: ice-binding family protein, partial [Desulfosalsimonadaceae bacterium]
MFNTKKFLNRKIRWRLLLSVVFVALGVTGPIVAFAAGPAPVDLLSAGNFVILAETGITNTGSHASDITGNIGNSPGTAAQMNGVWCSEITGTIYGVDAAYIGSGATTCFVGNPPLANKTLVDNAVGDMLTAYNNAAGVVTPAPVIGLGAGNISGLTIASGLYKWSTDVIINTNVTLSGGASDVWIFQIAGDLDIASGGSVPAGIKVILTGGARASNVFWQVGGGTGATLGTYSTFNGTILSAKQVILQTGAVLNGRALAQTQVTLDANAVTLPCPPITLTPPPLPQGTEDVLYNQTITASGGQAPYTFLVTAGILPTGLSFTNGLISGTPTAPGSFTFTVTATDANGCTGVQAYTIVINAPVCPPITLTPPPLPQ